MKSTQRLLILMLLGAVAATSVTQVSRGSRSRMAQAAQRFLSELDDAQRQQSNLAFEDANRTDWHYIPRTGRGLKFGEMNDAQRRAVHAMLRTALTEQGYLKAVNIMELENVLHDMESRPGRTASHRDPALYRVTVFGDPMGNQPWGWRVEGHHLSLNFSSLTNELSSATPFFFGTNPAEVRSGPRAGLRVLGPEEDLARALISSMSEAQRSKAIFRATAPADIIHSPGRDAQPERAEGIAYESLSDAQQHQMWQPAKIIMDNVQDDVSGMNTDHADELMNGSFFAWAGSIEDGQPHYWRIHGSHWIIEFDNTQNNANHIHLAWRDFSNDFGRDWLKEHYEHDHQPHSH